MNILFLSNNHLSPTEGGIERTTFNLVRELSKDVSYKIFAVFITIPVRIPRVECVEDIIHNGKQINDYIEKFSIDIIIFPTGAWYANLLKSYNPLLKCKIITCLHSPPKVGEDYIIKNLKLEWNKKTLKIKVAFLPQLIYTFIKYPFKVIQVRRQYNKGYTNSDAYVLLSKSFFNDFQKYANLDDIIKLRAIGNSLSFDEFYKVADIKLKKNEILVVSRFDEISKRISYAIKVWQLLDQKTWQFRIVGFGKDEDLYKNMVKEADIKNISFEGKRDPINYYKNAKIFLMTSSFEGWGMTLLEALQMGCVPVVMDSFTALHDIIKHNYNGIIIKNNDIDGMAKAVQYLIDNESEFLRMSKNAIDSSSEFTKEKIAMKWKELFFNLTE